MPALDRDDETFVFLTLTAAAFLLFSSLLLLVVGDDCVQLLWRWEMMMGRIWLMITMRMENVK